MAEAKTVSDVVDQLEDATDGDEVSVADVLESLGHASFAPLLIAPALIGISPAAGVPSFTAIIGLFIALVAAQMVLGMDHVWLPGWLKRRSLSSDRIKKAVDWLRPVAKWFDRHSHKRLEALVQPPIRKVTEVACLLCGAIMPLFELVPFTGGLLAGAVLLLALALLVRDGLYAVFAFVLMGGGVYLGWTLF